MNLETGAAHWITFSTKQTAADVDDVEQAGVQCREKRETIVVSLRVFFTSDGMTEWAVCSSSMCRPGVVETIIARYRM